VKRTLSAALSFFTVLLLSGVPALADAPVGWRTDGTGRYPQANPPTEWSAENNVVWKTALPGRSHSGPVVLGERVFVAAEPDVLLCLNAESGKIEWQKQVTMVDVFGAEKAAKIEADLKLAKELDRKSRELRREIGKLKKSAAPKEKVEALQNKSRELREKVSELRKYSGNRRGSNGNTTATPACDGKHVFAVFGNGVVAAFSPDGKGLWFKHVDAANIGFGHSASPVLVDGKLVVHYTDMVALDVNDGKELWRAKVPARHGSPIVAAAGKERIIVSPSGAVVNAADGTVLAEKLFRLGHCSPIIHENSIYAMSQGKVVAIELPKSPETNAEWKVRWEGAGMRQRRFASPVVHDGLLYGVTEKGILDVIDLATGKPVYRKRLDFGRRGRVYPSPTSAGKYVYLSADNGTTIVLQPGRQYQEVARNTLEPFSGAPVFVGSRMYVRGRKHMYCVGK